MNMVSHIADDDLSSTAEETAQLCREVFGRACRKALDSKSIVHLRQENGKAAKLFRLECGSELIVHKKNDDTLRLGFRAAGEGFREEVVRRQTASIDAIEWIAEEAQGKLTCHNEGRLLSLKF